MFSLNEFIHRLSQTLITSTYKANVPFSIIPHPASVRLQTNRLLCEITCKPDVQPKMYSTKWTPVTALDCKSEKQDPASLISHGTSASKLLDQLLQPVTSDPPLLYRHLQLTHNRMRELFWNRYGKIGIIHWHCGTTGFGLVCLIMQAYLTQVNFLADVYSVTGQYTKW